VKAVDSFACFQRVKTNKKQTEDGVTNGETRYNGHIIINKQMIFYCLLSWERYQESVLKPCDNFLSTKLVRVQSRSQ